MVIASSDVHFLGMVQTGGWRLARYAIRIEESEKDIEMGKAKNIGHVD